MKFILSAIIFAVLCVSLLAQKPDEVLATATGISFTPSSLTENVRTAYLNQEAAIAAERKQLLAAWVRESLLDAEAKAVNSTPEALLAAEIKKIAEPTAAEIKTVYDANRASLGSNTLEQVKPQIVGFLRNGAQQKALADLVERLKPKHKFVAGKDVNAVGLKPAEVLFSIDGRSFSAGDFNDRFKADIYDIRAEIAAQVSFDLENSIFSTLIAQEAKTRNIESGDLIAAEVTNKLRDFTDEERAALEAGLKKRLFEKYAVKVLFREPEPVARNVSADDDPVFGKPSAPVTVVMFSDFQCSACSATHPVLKSAIAGYGDKVRLVVRDFPLESIHPNAFDAALAANAARQQGKYFEYIEVLYRSQDALDSDSLKKYAAELGLNLKQFELDFSSEATAAEIRKDIAAGISYGAGGTPTIFVNGVKLQRLSTEGFKNAIDRALAGTASK